MRVYGLNVCILIAVGLHMNDNNCFSYYIRTLPYNSKHILYYRLDTATEEGFYAENYNAKI